MYRAVGFRVHLTHSQRLRIHKIRMGQRFVYDWAIERLQRDPTPTAYDLQKEFTELRRNAPHLLDVGRMCENTAIRQARAAADISKYGHGNLKFRTRKRDGRISVMCHVPPKHVSNASASMPGHGPAAHRYRPIANRLAAPDFSVTDRATSGN